MFLKCTEWEFFSGRLMLFWACALPTSCVMLAASLLATFQHRELKACRSPACRFRSDERSSATPGVWVSQGFCGTRFPQRLRSLGYLAASGVESSARRLGVTPFQMVLHMFRPITESMPADMVLMEKRKEKKTHTCLPPSFRLPVIL